MMFWTSFWWVQMRKTVVEEKQRLRKNLRFGDRKVLFCCFWCWWCSGSDGVYLCVRFWQVQDCVLVMLKRSSQGWWCPESQTIWWYVYIQTSRIKLVHWKHFVHGDISIYRLGLGGKSWKDMECIRTGANLGVRIFAQPIALNSGSSGGWWSLFSCLPDDQMNG